MRLEVDGAAGSPMKVMFYLGMLFVVLGLMIGLGSLVMVFRFNELSMLFFSIIFLAVFCGVGGLFAKLGYDGMHGDDAALPVLQQQGERHP